MLGKHLKFLAEVADLARLDFEAAGITLIKKDDKLYSRYRGAYSSGQRWLTQADVGKDEELPDLNVGVSAVQFKSLVGLFNEELPIKITLRGTALRMEGSGSRIDLATRYDMEDLEEETKIEEVSTEIITSAVDLLAREFSTAAEFAARSMSNPILTGLKISSDGDGLLSVQASDGYCLYLAEFPVQKTGTFDMVLPAYDVVLGLKLLGEGAVRAFKEEGRDHIVLLGDRAMFRSGAVRGAWPDTGRIMVDVPRQEPVEISSNLIRSLVQSVRILGSSNDLVLKADGENLYLQTTISENGAFQATIPATAQGTFMYDVSYYLLALNLGPQLSVHLPATEEGRSTTYMEADHRRFWIGQRIQSIRPMEPATAVLQQD